MAAKVTKKVGQKERYSYCIAARLYPCLDVIFILYNSLIVILFTPFFGAGNAKINFTKV